MASKQNHHLTFLIHTTEQHSDLEKKEQALRRHQHAATVAHQRNGRRRISSRPPTVVTDQLTPQQLTSDPHSTIAERVPAGAVGLEISLTSTPPLRSDPSGGLFDPFDVLHANKNSGHEQMVFRSAILDQWPSFALSSRGQDIDRWRSVTVRSALEFRFLLSAIIYAGASYRYFFGSTGSSNNIVRIAAYQDTLRQVREAVQALNGPCPEAVLLAVTILAIHGPPTELQGRAPSASQQLRDYEYYGMKTWEPTHLQVLLSLTRQRGGLRHMGMDSLAGMILTIDLVDSMLTMREPTFPLFFLPKPMLQALRQHRGATPSKACKGFRFLRSRRCGQRFLVITEDVQALLNAYGSFLQNPGASTDFLQLVTTWRVLQHQTLSVATGGDLLFELCRVAVLVFLVECLELLPAIGAFHHNNSRRLMMLIDECDKRDCWWSCPNLLLWTTILGGFTSREGLLRSWFIEELRSCPTPKVEEYWEEVLRSTEEFLPFGCRQAEGCRRFWIEACKWLNPTTCNGGTRTEPGS